MQTSETVRSFYKALESGELYEDGAWAVWQRPHSSDFGAGGAGPSSAGGGGGSGAAASGEACFK